jgi:SAM-dependent methyltransferase
VVDESLLAFVSESLPPAPARLLEVGAGSGELAEELRRRGYEVLAIDPASDTPAVEKRSLLELDAPPASFDAALAVLSLHHVEPLDESSAHLAELVRPGGPLVIDEFDIARLDVRAARWWSAHRDRDHGHDHAEPDPEAMVDNMRSHLHVLDDVVAALGPWFEFGAIERGPYLYRWALRPELRSAEEQDIVAGDLLATGARVVGAKKPG